MLMQTFRNCNNPILPIDIHVPDSEGHVMPDGRLYIYGSFDNSDDVFCSEEYHVVSTADLVDWSIFDKALDGNDIPWLNEPSAPHYPGIDWSNPTPFIQKMIERDRKNGIDIKKKFEEEARKSTRAPKLLFAPDCIFSKGRYYLYFCGADDSEGVAVSDDPQGPFTEPVQLPCGGIDPAVFIDDDGQAYYYWGQLFSHGVKLNSDMCSFDRSEIRDNLITEEEHYFHEGSSMRKIGGKYYYVYACITYGKPTSLGYAMSDSPMGSFQYKGVIINNEACDPASWNNHGSIEYFNGQWYVLYHRASGGVQQHRRLCMEKIEILSDGSIPEVKMTSQGVGKPFVRDDVIMGYQVCEVHGGCFVERDTSGTVYKEYLGNIIEGCSAVFRYISHTAERPLLGIRITGAGSGTIIVYLTCFDGNQLNAKELRVVEVGEFSIRDGNGTLMFPDFEFGEYELTLKFINSEGMMIDQIELY
jgi:hypothetical protein